MNNINIQRCLFFNNVFLECYLYIIHGKKYLNISAGYFYMSLLVLERSENIQVTLPCKIIMECSFNIRITKKIKFRKNVFVLVVERL